MNFSYFCNIVSEIIGTPRLVDLSPFKFAMDWSGMCELNRLLPLKSGQQVLACFRFTSAHFKTRTRTHCKAVRSRADRQHNQIGAGAAVMFAPRPAAVYFGRIYAHGLKAARAACWCCTRIHARAQETRRRAGGLAERIVHDVNACARRKGAFGAHKSTTVCQACMHAVWPRAPLAPPPTATTTATTTNAVRALLRMNDRLRASSAICVCYV